MIQKEKTYLRDGRSPIPLNSSTSYLMSKNKAKNTKPELTLRKALWNIGFKGYRLNFKRLPGKPDIVFPSKKIAIFVHGCFWHRCNKCSPNTPKSNQDFWSEKFTKNIERDKVKELQLINLGWNVLIIWECEVKNDLQEVLDKVSKYFV